MGAQESLENKCQIRLNFETEEAKRRPRVRPGQSEPCLAVSCYPYLRWSVCVWGCDMRSREGAQKAPQQLGSLPCALGPCMNPCPKETFKGTETNTALPGLPVLGPLGYLAPGPSEDYTPSSKMPQRTVWTQSRAAVGSRVWGWGPPSQPQHSPEETASALWWLLCGTCLIEPHSPHGPPVSAA